MSSVPAAERLDFNRDVRPILAGACWKCHGPDEEARKAKLRLDTRDGALAPAKSGKPAVVPGQPDASDLVARILTSDEDDLMPPPGSGKTLTSAQVETLRRWVAEGAEYRRHWAYEPPVPPPRPAVAHTAWPRNELDFHVLARLEAEGLSPASEAARATLVRRVFLDLTGLPPTVEELDAALNDAAPDWYENLVGRLLDSPHYGERWARSWLDMARYADTNGYEADYRRSNWPWRDWVIRALNADLPFDQFTIEQLAGDLLPDATRGQRVATGFHRNTMTNTEGGTDDEEFRVAAVVDRVNTTYTVWMGTTMACAQCHTHKYDPITIKDYYRSLAVFNHTTDGGKELAPELRLPTPEQQARLDAAQARVAALEKTLATQTPELDAALAAWRDEMTGHLGRIGEGWRPLRPAGAMATDGVELKALDDGSFLSTGPLPDHADYSFTVELKEPLAPTALRVEVLRDESLPHGGPGRHEEADFALTDVQVTVHPPAGGTNAVQFDEAFASFAMNGYGPRAAVDDDANSGWAVAAFEEKNRRDQFAVFVAKEAVELPAGTRIEITLRQRSSRAQHLLGRVRLAASVAPRAHLVAWGVVPADVRAILGRPEAERSADEAVRLAAHFRSLTLLLADTRLELEKARKELPSDIPSTLVLAERKEPRETHVMLRGNFLNKGDKVEAGTPGAFNPWPEGEPVNRLTFARWLVSTNNPLTARVTVNRVWAAYFGTGLVETSEEFGAQGELPSNAPLLDHLAIEFMARGWGLKALHRHIVTSATYRQASAATPELLARDPFNRLLARGPRVRLEAESLRDAALVIGGLLDRRVGGPPVMPDQPDGVWANPYNGDKWEKSAGGDAYRRGLYTFWRRTAPYASFMAFDAPSREVCAERRPRSNTPVQALVTLNDPAFLAAAHGLARAVLRDGGSEVTARLDYAFKRAVGRRPDAAEAARIIELLDAARTSYADNPAAAQAFVKSADGREPPPADAAELAAWQVVANVLLNLDETVTKG
ncbi:MAG: PSD1 and planctomycete cytochrome C domain-containing protein [Limisphaerales bacterium]